MHSPEWKFLPLKQKKVNFVASLNRRKSTKTEFENEIYFIKYTSELNKSDITKGALNDRKMFTERNLHFLSSV